LAEHVPRLAGAFGLDAHEADPVTTHCGSGGNRFNVETLSTVQPDVERRRAAASPTIEIEGIPVWAASQCFNALLNEFL
jgi:hypothetical protein